MSVAHAARRVVTCDPARATQADPLGVVEDGAIVVLLGRVTWVGPRGDLAPGVPVVDHGDVVLTPGLVDAHTHACWSGSRHAEYAVRMAGGNYEAIAKAGGGIVSTHKSVVGCDAGVLAQELAARLARMATLEAGRPPAAAAMDRSAVVIWVSASGAHHAGRAVGAHRSLFTLSPIPRAGTEVLLHVAGCSLQAVRGQAASRAA